MPLFALKNWSVRFKTPDGMVNALSDISISVQKGECLGIVGESGSGKSQMMLSAFGLLASNGETSGVAAFDNQPIEPQKLLGRSVGFIFQDPLTSLTPHLTVGQQMVETLCQFQSLSIRDARKICIQLLDRCRISDVNRRINQYPHELSGGMRQRVMIAQALTSQPDMLIADEPTTALDVTVQAQVLALLRELQAERSMALVFITHDMGVVAGMADRIAVLQSGSIIELAETNKIFLQPQHDYTRLLIAARRTVLKPKDSTKKQIPCLVAENISVHFQLKKTWREKQRLTAVDGVDVRIAESECLAVIGESGCGKSTLARALLGLQSRSAGKISLASKNVDTMSVLARCAAMQIVFQDPFASLDPRMSIGAAIAEPLQVLKPELNAADRRVSVLKILDEVGIAKSWFNRYPHELSGGQNQRVGMARALIVDPKLLICDEAISALDTTTAMQILDLLLQLKRNRSLSIMFITHDLGAAFHVADRVMVLFLGRVAEEGRADALRQCPQHPYTQTLLAAEPVADPEVMRNRAVKILDDDVPSPLDSRSAMRFLKSRMIDDPTAEQYRPKMLAAGDDHMYAEHDVA